MDHSLKKKESQNPLILKGLYVIILYLKYFFWYGWITIWLECGEITKNKSQI